MMTKLRLLTIDNVQLPRGLNFLSNELCMMIWDKYPLKSLPRTFGPKKLVLLRMHDSHIKELPKGFSNLDRLKILDFTDSQNLVKTPDFIGLPNLEILIFQGCTRLCVVDSSVSYHKRLILLNLKDCKCLKSLPLKINMESLKTFILSGCSSLKTFPEIGLNMTRLSMLYLDGTSMEELPLSMERLTGLTLLDLQGCKNFSSFPNVIYSLTSLKSLNLSGVKVQQPKSWHFLGLSTIISSIAAIARILCANCFFLAQHPEPQPNFVLLKSLTRLSSFELLNLSNCSLEDGALPDNLSCLSSLSSLNLSRNRLTRLPDGISQLFNLEYLCLNGCSRLQSLTNLPLSIRLVEARECTSLENYSNQFVVWTSGESGFAFIDCVGLANNEDLEMSMSNANLLYSLTSRFTEKAIDELGLFQSMIPQIEMPKWFSHQNPGSTVPNPLPPELYDDSSWKGIALCTVFVVHKNFNNVSWGQASSNFQMFLCRLDMDGGVVDSPIAISVHRDKLFPGSFGLWLLISHKRFRERLDARGSISPSLITDSPDIEIKLTGARILYKKDVLDFLQNLNQHTSHFERMNTHLRIGYVISFERTKTGESSGQTDSNATLKRELKFLLSKLYQEDKAKTHWYDYIFPQTSIPRWFEDRDFSSRTEMQLPSDWQNNTRLIGFAACALYTVQKQPTGSDQRPKICLSFFGPGNEVASTRLMTFPLSRDIFAESHRLLVFYIPRILFPLDQCSKIWVSFHSNNTSLEVETCGVRLVHETDIEAFVRMLVQCMLQCPDVYHEFYRQSLLDQLAMSEGCDHGKDSDYSFSTQRRSQPMPKLLSSTENVAEGCTSLGVFPDQVILECISRDSTPTFVYSNIPFARNPSSTSFDLGIPFGQRQDTSATSMDILESLFKTYFQGQNGTSAILRHCYPQSEIPRWFCHQSDSPSRTILLFPSIYDNPDWMGFAVCSLFSFHKHPTAIRKNLNATAFHEFSCLLALDSTPLVKVDQSITEDEVLISLCQRSFIWVLFIPRRLISSHWGHCMSAEFSFVSDSRDVSPLKCGVTPVNQQNLKDFGDTVLQLLISYIRSSNDIRKSCKESVIYERLPILLDKNLGTDSIDEELQSQRLPFYLTEPCGSDNYHFPLIKCKHSNILDFDPSFIYSSCFPSSKTTQEWFTHRSCGHSVTMDMPPNLYADNNWLGLALYACFSIDGDPMPAIDKVVNGVKHFLYCRMLLLKGNYGFDGGIAFSSNNGEEVTWLINLGQCIWISYFPRWKFKNRLDKCRRFEASFVSDLPGVIVQNCALGLLYRHNQLQLEQRLKHSNALTLQYQALALSVADRQTIKEQSLYDWIDTFTCRNFQMHVFKIPNIQAEADGTKAQLNTSDLLDLHGCSIYSLCFPPTEVLNWFSKRSNGPTFTIDVPSNLYNNDWMGLLLCAHFSCVEHQATIPEKLDSAISHQLICRMESNVAGLEPLLYVHGITKEELTWLCAPDGIFWLSYIPRLSFPNWLNGCSYLEASFICDGPGIVIQKCGGRFVHVLEEMELEQIIFRCISIPVVVISKQGARVQRLWESRRESHTHSTTGLERTNGSNEDQQNEISTRSFHRNGSNGTKNLYNQSNEPDFDKCLVYTSCFPPNEILDWFSHQSDEPTMVITPPPNFHNDHTWMGLALVVSFSVQEHSTNIVTNLDSQFHCLLFCQSEGIEHFHTHFLTEGNLMLLRLGGFIWLSYIPHEWFSNWLNHSSSIEASIVADYPGLTMQKCGFRFLHQNDEIEWKKTKKHCETSLLEIRDVLHQVEETTKPIHGDKEKPSTTKSSDEDSRLERLRGFPDPKLKDKGKRVVD